MPGCDFTPLGPPSAQSATTPAETIYLPVVVPQPHPAEAAAANHQIYLGATQDSDPMAQHLELARANRHGLIAGATGGGKTVTLQVLAEGFAKAGVPVLIPDIKGDLSGLAQRGIVTADVQARWSALGPPPLVRDGLPVTFWDVFGEEGHTMQLSVKEMGPSLLSRLLNLTDAQDGVLAIVFQLARDFDLPLVVLEDLRVILLWMAAHGDVITLRYGAFTIQTIGGIQRRLNALDYEGLGEVFGATRLDLRDLIHRDEASIGRVNILSANRLIQSPRLYGAVLTWLLQTLYRQLPEIGDVDRPRLVLFFDEAHLLFKDSPKLLCDEIERMVRLIRSKGVGVYFVTQSPGDLPAPVLGQLGNRVLHALRGYTPRDLKAIRSVAETFRSNPEFDTQAAIVDLQIGEALVSTLGCSGEPSVVQKILIRPPSTQIGTIDAETRAKIIAASPLDTVYTRGRKHISDRDATAQRLDSAFGVVAIPTDPLHTEFPKTFAAPLPARIPDHPARRLYRRVHAKLDGARLGEWVEVHAAGLGRRLVRLVLKRRGPTPEYRLTFRHRRVDKMPSDSPDGG